MSFTFLPRANFQPSSLVAFVSGWNGEVGASSAAVLEELCWEIRLEVFSTDVNCFVFFCLDFVEQLLLHIWIDERLSRRENRQIAFVWWLVERWLQFRVILSHAFHEFIEIRISLNLRSDALSVWDRTELHQPFLGQDLLLCRQICHRCVEELQQKQKLLVKPRDQVKSRHACTIRAAWLRHLIQNFHSWFEEIFRRTFSDWTSRDCESSQAANSTKPTEAGDNQMFAFVNREDKIDDDKTLRRSKIAMIVCSIHIYLSSTLTNARPTNLHIQRRDRSTTTKLNIDRDDEKMRKKNHNQSEATSENPRIQLPATNDNDEVGFVLGFQFRNFFFRSDAKQWEGRMLMNRKQILWLHISSLTRAWYVSDESFP